MPTLRIVLYTLGALGYFFSAYVSYKTELGWQVTFICTALGLWLSFAAVVLIIY